MKYQAFGPVLKAGLECAGLSLRQLGRRLGVSGSYLSRIESGFLAPLGPEHDVGIQQELGIPVGRLEALRACDRGAVDVSGLDATQTRHVLLVVDALRAGAVKAS